MIKIFQNYNLKQNISILFHVLAKFLFVSSEMELVYFHQKSCTFEMLHELPNDLRRKILEK